MNVASIILGVMLLFTGLIMSLLSLPMIKGKVKPNKLYGVRLKKAFESEDNWYKINEYGGKQIFIAGIIQSLIGIIALLFGNSLSPIEILFISFSPILVLLVPVINIIIYAKKL